MSFENLDWTNRNSKDAEAALKIVTDFVAKYGMQLVLEALIHHNSNSIVAAQMFGVEDDYLLLLNTNLEKTLKEYKDRHNEFKRQ